VGPIPDSILLGVDALGNRIAAIARLYERFHAHSMKIIYTSACSTATGGSVAMAISKDAESPGMVPPSFGTILQFDDAECAPVWGRAECHYRMASMSEWLYCSLPGFVPSPVSADNRDTNFGSFQLAGNFTYPVDVALGTIWCEFDLILAGATPDLGFTLASEVVRLCGPGFQSKLVDAVIKDPVPFFSMCDAYLLGDDEPVKSDLDVEIERFLEARGLVPKYIPTRFEKWLANRLSKASAAVCDEIQGERTRISEIDGALQELLRKKASLTA
jgi:hypothetical protein